MNAIEHGNKNHRELAVHFTYLSRTRRSLVRVTVMRAPAILNRKSRPGAKLAACKSPRGWGLFLIEKMVTRCT